MPLTKKVLWTVDIKKEQWRNKGHSREGVRIIGSFLSIPYFGFLSDRRKDFCLYKKESTKFIRNCLKVV